MDLYPLDAVEFRDTSYTYTECILSVFYPVYLQYT